LLGAHSPVSALTLTGTASPLRGEVSSKGRPMRHKALPYLLPALQSLPPLLSSLYAEFGFRRTRLRAENRFRRRVVPAIGYTQTMIAPRLQAQLSPWLRELLEAPELAGRIFERFVLEMPAAVQEA